MNSEVVTRIVTEVVTEIVTGLVTEVTTELTTKIVTEKNRIQTGFEKRATAVARFRLFFQKFFQSRASLGGRFFTAERGQAEISFPVFAEPAARRSDDLYFV